MNSYLFIFIFSIFASVVVATEDTNLSKQLFFKSLELHKQGKIVEAINKLEQAQAIDPDNPNIIANLALFSGQAGLYEKAVKYYTILMRLEPDNVQAMTGHAIYKSYILSKAKDFKRAIHVLEQAVTRTPKNPSILWNLGIFSAENEEHKKALRYLSRLATLEPNNMHLQSKLIQSYQALDDIKNRQRALNKLLDMYKSNADPRYIKHNRFCREQYKIGNWKILVFQYFNPGNKDLYFYRYSATDETGIEKFWLSLGSYQATTDIARETGSISTTQRIYHLDYYDKKLHSTLGMYQNKPDYDQLRPITRQLITEKITESTKASLNSK